MTKHITLVLLLLLCGCASQPGGKDVVDVAALRGPSALALAQWMAYPPSIGGKPVRIRIAETPDILQASLRKGEADIVMLPMTTAVNLIRKGIPYRLAGCPVWGTLYLVEKEGTPPADRTLHLFGAGTTPDILARHYLDRNSLRFDLNYSFPSAGEIVQGLAAGKISRAVISEPYLTLALRQDSTLRVIADLNRLEGQTEGFPQTAVIVRNGLDAYGPKIDRLLAEASAFATGRPLEAIRILEENGVFPRGALTAESVRRCAIGYQTAREADGSIAAFLELIRTYEPRAIGEGAAAAPLWKRAVALLAGPQLYLSVAATVARGIIGMLLSLVLALGAAALMARYHWISRLMRPVLSVMRSVPVISFILLALILLRPEGIPLLIAFLVMFPLLAENLTKGLLNRQPALDALSRLFLLNRPNRLLHIWYPQVKPYLFSGLASAMGFGWRAVIMGEALAQCRPGIGGEMKQAQAFIDIPGLIAWTAVAMLVGFLFDKAVRRLEAVRPPLLFASADKVSALCGTDVCLSGTSFSYGGDDVVHRFTRRFEGGRIYGISAPSGAGKTTLLMGISGLLAPREGSVEADRSHGVAMVFQEPLLLPHLTVEENILLPLAACYSRPAASALAAEHLRLVEMDAFAGQLPAQLSYGQQQRIAIARALTFPSPLLLLDEPFKGLDASLATRIIQRIRSRHQKERQTILFTTHNPSEIKQLADEVVAEIAPPST